MDEIKNAVKTKQLRKVGTPVDPSEKHFPSRETNEATGERMWFRNLGKWNRQVQQVFMGYPLVIKLVFDMIDSRQDHRSFSKSFEQVNQQLPHFPNLRSISQDDLADSLLSIGFNVKSSKATGSDGREVTRYEFIMRPSSLQPELLLKTILIATKATNTMS